jgi:hypothetical protein
VKFKDFFRKKTGVDWDERLIRTDVTDKSLFQYTPPVSMCFTVMRWGKEIANGV